MAKYLWKCRYTTTGLQGVLKEGGDARRNAAEKLIQSAGGQLESFYYALGDVDLYGIADFPDAASCAAAAMQATAAGGVHIETVALLTTEEINRAASMTVDYRPPGA